jgi:hypothetical protein
VVNLKFNNILNQVELMYISRHESSVYYTSLFLHISSVQKYMHNSEEVLPYLVEIIVEVNHSTNMNFLRKGIQTHTSSFIGFA